MNSPTRRAWIAAALGLLGASSSARAQGRIAIAAGDGTPVRVETGTVIAVPVNIDMSQAAGGNIASLSAALLWSQTFLTLDSVKAGGFGSLTSNIDGAPAGIAVLSAFSAIGATTSTSLATLFFTASAQPGGTQVRPLPYTAGDELGASVLSAMRARALDVCVATRGLWGDANGDDSVDILDAQQIARFSIGLSLASGFALRGRGDVNEDGAVNIIDAQQIARYSIELPSAPRVNARTLVVPEVSSITSSPVSATVQVGRAVQLTASAVDTSGAVLSGCAPITWSSSDTTMATVDQGGVVTGISAGVPTITATSGGVAARIAMTVGVGAIPASMTVVQGDGQYRLDANYAVKPQIRVVDSLNQAVPGVSVLFTANSGGVVTLKSGAQRLSATVVTDSSGLAEIAGWRGGGTPVPGQTTYDGYVLQSVERVTATVPGLPPVTITGITLENGYGLSPSICLLTLAGATYCHGEWVSDAFESADSTTGSVPVLVPDGVPMATLSPGFDGMFSCGVARTGDGYCWGWNPGGQLGDGTENRSRGMRRVAGDLSFLKIASGYAHACGITTSGRPYCWGLNENGQLGTGPVGGISTIPVAVNGTDRMLDIATGWGATCGVTTGGDTWCWGTAPFIDSAGARVATPRRIPGAPAFTKISLGQTVACGMTAAGQVNCWGTGGPALGDGSTANRYTTFSTVALRAPAREIWGNLDDFCASTTDGGLYCWGKNGSTQIAGVGDALPHSTPALVGFVNALRGQMQPFGFCYQDATNQPFCFGRYAIGDGLPPFSSRNPLRFSPVPVKWVEGLPDVAASITVVAGAQQSAAAGVSVTVAPSVMVRDVAGNPLSGASVTFAVTGGGGSITGGTTTTDASGIATVGSWTLGSLGANDLTVTSSAASTMIRATATPAPSFMQVISGDAQVQTGTNSGVFGPTGRFVAPVKVEVYDASERPLPDVAVTFTITSGAGTFSGPTSVTVPTDANGIASAYWTAGLPVGVQTATVTVNGIPSKTFTGTSTVGISQLSRCSLASGGKAYCWGDNTHGEVGDGTFTGRTTPTPVGGGITFTVLAEGAADHACGLTGSGQMYCWGANNFGQLGDGSLTDSSTPILAASGETFSDVAVSAYNTCGIRTDQSLMCWGWTGYDLFNDGQLGIIHPPTVVGYYEVPPSKIALGPSNACLLDRANSVHCWGLGTSGQLGDGSFESRSAPAFSGVAGSYSSVTVGATHVCALATSGTAYCWGLNTSGQLGNGGFARTATPTPVQGSMSFTSISASPSSSTCGSASDGVAYCWGITTGLSDRFWGQLGDGTTTPRAIPTQVLTGVQFAKVSTRFGTGCGFVASGQPYCWGSNFRGQVGDGTTTARLAPVPTKWPEGTTGIPVSLTVNSGNGQAAVVGTAVTSPSVIVKDYAGTPLIGTTVTFTVTSGDGSVGTATAVTNGLGIATVDSWVLGPTPGANTLTVTAPGLPTVVITATGLAGGGG